MIVRQPVKQGILQKNRKPARIDFFLGIECLPQLFFGRETLEFATEPDEAIAKALHCMELLFLRFDAFDGLNRPRQPVQFAGIERER